MLYSLVKAIYENRLVLATETYPPQKEKNVPIIADRLSYLWHLTVFMTKQLGSAVTNWSLKKLLEGEGHGQCAFSRKAGTDDLDLLTWVNWDRWISTHISLFHFEAKDK